MGSAEEKKELQNLKNQAIKSLKDAEELKKEFQKVRPDNAMRKNVRDANKFILSYWLLAFGFLFSSVVVFRVYHYWRNQPTVQAEHWWGHVSFIVGGIILFFMCVLLVYEAKIMRNGQDGSSLDGYKQALTNGSK